MSSSFNSISTFDKSKSLITQFKSSNSTNFEGLLEDLKTNQVSACELLDIYRNTVKTRVDFTSIAELNEKLKVQ